MAKNANVECQPDTWTELTDAEVSALRLQNLGVFSARIMVTTGSSEPTDDGGAIQLVAGGLLAANVDLADIFPGVAAGYRVWATCAMPCVISVSHA